MRKVFVLLLGVLFLGGVTPAQTPSSDKVLEFGTMVGVSGPFVGTTNPIRGISGGGVPWTISEGRGELRADGRVEVKIRGLVLVATGINPVDMFRAVVSCRSIDGTGNPSIVNLPTENFPANTLGDSDIEDTVELPHPCIAAIIFVTNPAGRWFAVTGRS